MFEQILQTDDRAFSRTEIIVGKIWAELLQYENINPQDNFFQMGGDSLMIMTMLFRIGDVLGVGIRPGTLMDAPTLREFCQVIDSKKTGIQSESDEIQNDASANATGVIARNERKDKLPVSFIQEQVVGAEVKGLYDPDTIKSHSLYLCYRITGEINIPALDRALCEIVRRHEILRTGYSVVDGTIFQNVNDAPLSILHVEDLCNLAQGDRDAATEPILKKIATESFSFLNDKLMISATLITGGTDHILAIVANHVATDHLSMILLQNELLPLYQAFSHHEPSSLPDLPIQYADFAIWEREYFKGDRLEAMLAYWRKLAHEPLDSTLPADHIPTAISYAGDTVPVTISPELTGHLLQLGHKCGVTPFTVLFAAFISLIHAFSGYRYNFFCIPVANRSRGETRSLIGCFMNFQFVYVDLSGNPTFLELVERLNRILLDAYDNYVPFHFITQQIPPQGPVVDFQMVPSLDKCIVRVRSRAASSNADPVSNEPSFIPFILQRQEFALFPIDVRLLESSDRISGHFKYQTAAYDRNTIVDLVNDYLSFLARMARDPEIRLYNMGLKPHHSVAKAAS